MACDWRECLGASDQFRRDKNVHFIHGAGREKTAQNLGTPLDKYIGELPSAELVEHFVQAVILGCLKDLTSGIS